MAMPRVFISYSHKDEEWKDKLVSHLGVVTHTGILQTWDDRRIGAGSDWLPQIENALAACDIALLMVSADFLNSRFILQNEVPTLLKRRESAGLRVIPIIVKPCAWQQVPWLKTIQARPKDGKALTTMAASDADHALVGVVEDIVAATDAIHLEHRKRKNQDLLWRLIQACMVFVRRVIRGK